MFREISQTRPIFVDAVASELDRIGVQGAGLIRVGIPLGLMALVSVALIACEDGDAATREFQWTGMPFHAGAEMSYFITPLDETKAKGDPKTIEVGNDGDTLLSYNFGGKAVPGRIYYFVDGNGDGRCDDYSTADITGFKEFPADELTTNINYEYDAAKPEGICRWFPDSAVVAQPTNTPVPAKPDDTPTPVLDPTPNWVAANEGPVLAALERFYLAVSDFDADGAVAASTEQSAAVVRQDVEMAAFILLEGNPSWWREYTVTSIDQIECEEFVCDLEATINLTTKTVDSIVDHNSYQMRFESGEWRYHALPDYEYEPPTN